MISRMGERRSLACRWADLALLGITVNLAVLIAAPIARPDLDLLDKALSYYAVGPWGLLQQFAFVAVGVASIALGVAFGWSRPSSRWMPLAQAALVVSGIASIGLVVWPMGVLSWHTFIGDAHQTSGTVGGVAQLVAALAFVLAVRADRRWRPLYWPAVGAFVASVAGAVITQAEIWWPDLPIPMGASSRLVVIPLILLWGAVALRLRQRCVKLISQSAAAK
jgi:hypothetical protein